MGIVSWLRICNRCLKQGVQVCSARKYAVPADSDATTAVECLGKRSILRVSGSEVSTFLQGLVTNDMRHLEEGAVSMYAMFLNIKGRVLCDTIIYKTEEKDVYFVECDVNILPNLKTHLKHFRVRKKIDIDSMENLVKVVVFYTPKDLVGFNTLSEAISIETVKNCFSEANVVACRDPRLPILGVRAICPAAALDSLNIKEVKDKKINYRMFRYRLGVGEGIDDLPPEKCFPLEVNCDYLHGVSFHKGCYIGQELTARTHHTGTVRKRIMPLVFDLIPKNGFVPDMPILNSSEKVIGKLRGAERDTGLGMLRVAEALECRTFKISDATGHTYKPAWWPQTAPKDRVCLAK